MTGKDLTLGRVHAQLYRKFSTEMENTKQNDIATLMGASFHRKKPPPAVLRHRQRCQCFCSDGSLSLRSHSGDSAHTEEILLIARFPNSRFSAAVGSIVTCSATARLSSELHNLTLR